MALLRNFSSLAALTIGVVLLSLPNSASAALFIVDAQTRDYVPADTTINVGDTVRWTGLQSGVGHNTVQVSLACYNNSNCTTPLAGGFNSGSQGAVSQFEFTFNTQGTFYFICQPHQDDEMRGRIIVNAGPTPTPTGTPTPSPTPSPTPTPPPNDQCADAICLTDGVPFSSSSVGATGTDISSCGTNDSADVWFSYTPAFSGLHTIDTCALNGFDTVISIFDGCSGSELGCYSNNVCPPQDLAAFNMTAGVTYYVRLAGVNGATGNYTMTVTGGGGGCGNQATSVGGTIPAQLAESHPYIVDVTMLNSGTTTWSAAGGYFLSVILDPCAMGPGGQTVAIPAGVSIPPGAQHTFTFTITAPAGLQTCNMNFRMSQTGPGLFGQTVSVSPQIVALVNNAQFNSSTIPAQMFTSIGQYHHVTVRNLGNAPWIPGGSYTLSVNTDGCSLVGAPNISPNELVKPNTNHNFAIYLVTPASPQACSLQLQMKENGSPFGPTSNYNINIVVKPNASRDWSVYN